MLDLGTELWPFSRCILLASWPMSWVARSPSLGPGKMLGDRPKNAWFIDSPFWCTALREHRDTLFPSPHALNWQRKTPRVINNYSSWKELSSSSGQRRLIRPWLSTVCDLWYTSSPNQCASQSKSHLPLCLACAILSAILYNIWDEATELESKKIKIILFMNKKAFLQKTAIH